MGLGRGKALKVDERFRLFICLFDSYTDPLSHEDMQEFSTFIFIMLFLSIPCFACSDRRVGFRIAFRILGDLSDHLFQEHNV